MFILKILVIVMIYWKLYIINELWLEGWSILKTIYTFYLKSKYDIS